MTPVRTCIGCRTRSTTSDLLRLVVTTQGPRRIVEPDPRGTAPGRGAHLHPTTVCLDRAVRRKAFVRALRASAPLETGPVRDYVEQLSSGSPGETSGAAPGTTRKSIIQARSPRPGTTRKRSSRS